MWKVLLWIARHTPQPLVYWILIVAINKASNKSAPDSVNGLDILKANDYERPYRSHIMHKFIATNNPR